VLLQVAPGGGLALWIKPPNLSDARERGLEVRDVHRPSLIVVGKMTEPRAVLSYFDEREGRIGKAVDPGSTPFFGEDGGRQREKRTARSRMTITSVFSKADARPGAMSKR
jgi:hypothetical protein